MKKNILILFVIFSIHSFAQDMEWAKSFGDTLSDEGICMATDNASNIYIGGISEDLIDMGNGRDTTYGTWDGIVTKLSKNGEFIWYKAFGSLEDKVYVTSLATDMESNLYVTGKFRNELHFNDQLYAGYGDDKNDIFISKLDLDGNHIWTKILKGSKDDEPFSLKYANGNIFVSGKFQDTLYIDANKIYATDPASSSTTSHGFVFSFDTEGNTNWINFFDGGTGYCRKIDVDLSNVYAIVENKDNCKIVNGISNEFAILTASVGKADVYVIQFDAETGSVNWGNRMGDVGADLGYGITVDNFQNVYAGGVFTGTTDTQVTFDSQNGTGGSFDGFGKFDFFLVKYDSDGNYIWAKVYGTTESEGIFSGDIVCTEKSSVYASVYYLDPSTQFESDIFTCEEGWDGIEALLLKFDLDGNYKWGKQTSLGKLSDLKHTTYIRDLELTRGDTLLLVGNFLGEGYFIEESFTLSSQKESKDIFVGKYIDQDEIHGVSGINDFALSSDKVEVYPNPSRGIINFNYDPTLGQLVGLSILDVSGKEINNYQLSNNSIEISESGMYIIQFRLEKGIVYQKVIIQ